MKLFSFTASQPIQFVAEGALSSSSFQVGAGCGAGVIASIEKTALGIIVKRVHRDDSNPEIKLRDLFIDAPGVGELLEKLPAEPAQLKASREGKN